MSCFSRVISFRLIFSAICRFSKVSGQYAGKKLKAVSMFGCIFYFSNLFKLSGLFVTVFITFMKFWDFSADRMIWNVYATLPKKKYGLWHRAWLKKRRQFDTWRSVSLFSRTELKQTVKLWVPNFLPMSVFEVSSVILIFYFIPHLLACLPVVGFSLPPL